MFSKKEFDNKKVVKGFTLVEIIVVLVILAVLAAATIPSLLGFIDDAKFKTIDNEASVVRNAAQAYATEQSAKGETDDKIVNDINGVINSNHALHNLLQNDANGTVFETKVEKGKIRKFKYTKEIIDTNEDIITDKIRYAAFDDEKTSLLHATGAVTTIDAETFKANIIAEVTAALKSDDPESLKSTLTSSLTTDLNSSLETGMNSKIAALKTNFRTELGSNVVDLVYPVGSYYVSHSSTSPATLFSGTTWTQITDKFLYCVSSGAGGTGGSSTHTHQIGIRYGDYWSNICRLQLYDGSSWHDTSQNGEFTAWHNVCNAQNAQSDGVVRYEAKASITADNMPPYMKVYCWRRTA